jgi:putative solute:sodium symporter small subunit
MAQMPTSSSDPNSQTLEMADQRNTEPNLRRPEVHILLERYWRKNVRITVILLAIWAIVGLGCGVLLADYLNRYKLPGTGFPLGFWFAHQGSIIVFVLLILIYCIFLNRLDAQHHKDLSELNNKNAGKNKL